MAVFGEGLGVVAMSGRGAAYLLRTPGVILEGGCVALVDWSLWRRYS